MGDAVLALYQRTRTVSRWLSWLAVVVLLVISMAITVDVLMRWLFSSPVHGLEDVVALIITIAIAACFPAAMALRANITVRMLGKVLGPRASCWLELFGQTVALAFIVLVSWQLAVHVADVAGRVTSVIAVPIQWSWQVAFLLCAMAAVVQTVVVLAHGVAALRGEPLPVVGDGGPL